MAITVTSITPLAATTLGGTLHTVTGTGLTTVVMVLVKNVQAQIVGTPSGTSLVFRAPAQAAAGTAAVRFLDNTTEVTASESLTYSAVTAPEVLISQSPAHFRCDVRIYGDTNPRKPIRNLVDFKSEVAITTVDDTTWQSGFWGSDAKVQGKWSLTATVNRGTGGISGVYDPGQEIVRLSEDQTGTAGLLDVAWYDLNGGPEAYQGLAMAKWSPNGGQKASLETVAMTLTGQGPRNLITNPVIADPSLKVY